MFLSIDFLETLLLNPTQFQGQRAKDFGYPSEETLQQVLRAHFGTALSRWRRFVHAISEHPDDISIVRSQWILPLLNLLGFTPIYNQRTYHINDLHFRISHRADEDLYSPPIHIVRYTQDLDRQDPTTRSSPFKLLQTFLDQTPALWGIVTNGRELRLVRDTQFLRRPAYLSFALDQIFNEELFPDFELLFRLLHRSRFPQSPEATDCWLEQYYQDSLIARRRGRSAFGNAALEFIRIFVNGFLQHPRNTSLRTKIQESKISADFLYDHALRVLTRFILVLSAEERHILASSLYRDHYSLSRLYQFLSTDDRYDSHHDLWLSLRVLWELMRDESAAALLNVTPLGNAPFEPVAFDFWVIRNSDLLAAFEALSFVSTSDGGKHRLNYAAIGTEELGSLYEAITNHRPSLSFKHGLWKFQLLPIKDSFRKGFAVTPPAVAATLVRKTIDPLLEQRLQNAETLQDKHAAILAFRICDPACGSGQFLVLAAQRLTEKLIEIHQLDSEQSPRQQQQFKREVIAHCLYGVDLSPRAVEICKLALWLESMMLNRPLLFLDHHIRCGNALIGAPLAFVGALSKLEEVPKWRKKDTEEIIRYFFFPKELIQLFSSAIGFSQQFPEDPADTLTALREQQQHYRELRELPEFRHLQGLLDFLLLPWFQQCAEDSSTGLLSPQDFRRILYSIITTRSFSSFREILEEHLPPSLFTLADQLSFFHWLIEFPQISFKTLDTLGPNPNKIKHWFSSYSSTDDAGFDVILCTPPFSAPKFSDTTFFQDLAPEIAKESNEKKRRILIEQLATTNSSLYEEWLRERRMTEAIARYLSDNNFYAAFLRRARQLLAPNGVVGMILPTSIATLKNNARLFSSLMCPYRGLEPLHPQLIALLELERSKQLNLKTGGRKTFSLLIFQGSAYPLGRKSPQFAFGCSRLEEIEDSERTYSLNCEDIETINPQTFLLPTCATRQDMELLLFLYRSAPQTGHIPETWQTTSLIHVAKPKLTKRSRQQFENNTAASLHGNRFVDNDEIWIPAYPRKLIHRYHHRHHSKVMVNDPASLPPLRLIKYWTVSSEVAKAFEGKLSDLDQDRYYWKQRWFIGYSHTLQSDNSLPIGLAVLPWSYPDCPVIVQKSRYAMEWAKYPAMTCALFLANANTLIVNYAAIQKLNDKTITEVFFEQLPLLPFRTLERRVEPIDEDTIQIYFFPSSAFDQKAWEFILPRVLELSYTSWDVKAFADDLWREALQAQETNDPEQGVRIAPLLRKQWEANRAATGGVDSPPPEWLQAYPEISLSDGFPFPPFRWDERRRLELMAELEVYFAKLYGLSRKQLRYILDPSDLTQQERQDLFDPAEEVDDPLAEEEYQRRRQKHRILSDALQAFRRWEEQHYGQYLSRRLILERWDQIQ